MFNYRRLRNLREYLENSQKSASDILQEYKSLIRVLREYISLAGIPRNFMAAEESIFQTEINRIKEQRAQEAKEDEINALIKKALLDAGLIKSDKNKK